MTSSEVVPKNEDVTLACAFIPDPAQRAEVLCLFAFLETLRDIPERITEPLMGEIRMRWWYEAIEEIRDGRPVRYHPLTDALKLLVAKYSLDPAVLLDIVEGQMALLDKSLTLRDTLDVVDRGDGQIHKLAAHMLDPSAPQGNGVQAARLMGLVDLKAKGYISADDLGIAELGHLMDDIRADLQGVTSTVLPIILPAVLAKARWQGTTVGPLGKRFRLFWFYLTGRI